MAENVYREAVAELTRKAELLQEQIGLFERLAELNEQLEGMGLAVPVPPPKVAVKTAPAAKAAPAQPAAPKNKGGRPKKADNGQTVQAKPAKAVAKKGTSGVETDDGKTMDLPTLLERIGAEVKRPLKQADFVTLVREAGYKTQAKDFSNMVYQSLLKLVHRGVFEKNAETREYTYVGQKAA